jgi:hypothetical protein
VRIAVRAVVPIIILTNATAGAGRIGAMKARRKQLVDRAKSFLTKDESPLGRCKCVMMWGRRGGGIVRVI